MKANKRTILALMIATLQSACLLPQEEEALLQGSPAPSTPSGSEEEAVKIDLSFQGEFDEDFTAQHERSTVIGMGDYFARTQIGTRSDGSPAYRLNSLGTLLSVDANNEGQLILASEEYLLNINPDGSYNEGFASLGTYRYSQADFKQAVFHEGKIYAAATYTSRRQGNNFALFSLQLDGTANPEFPVQYNRNVVMVQADSGSYRRSGFTRQRDDEALGLMVQSTGELILVGTTDDNLTKDAVAIRYTQQGRKLRQTRSIYSSQDDHVSAWAMLSDDRFLLGGHYFDYDLQETRLFLIRYAAQATEDLTYGENGYQTLDLGSTNRTRITKLIPIQEGDEEQILIAGHDRDGAFLCKINFEGERVETFGEEGCYRDSSKEVRDAIRLADGRILLSASTEGSSVSKREMALLMLDAQGSLDPSFARAGIRPLQAEDVSNRRNLHHAGGTMSVRTNAEGKEIVTLVGGYSSSSSSTHSALVFQMR